MAERKSKDPMTLTKPRKPHDGSKCGADKKHGGTCTQIAGWGTDHPGSGKCKLHGGSTPIKHGRYSSINRPRIAELIKQFEADDDPTNLLPEVQMLRALVVDFVERYDKFTEALIHWHDSWGSGDKENPKPRQVIDILSVGKFLEGIGNLVDKIQKQRQEGTITLAALDRVVEQLGMEVVNAAQEVIGDADQRTALLQVIERRWGSVRVEPGKPGSKGTP